VSYSSSDFADTLSILADEFGLPAVTPAQCEDELGEVRDEEDEDQNRRVLALRIQYALEERAELKDEMIRASR
jgi:hypothetical protein